MFCSLPPPEITVLGRHAKLAEIDEKRGKHSHGSEFLAHDTPLTIRVRSSLATLAPFSGRAKAINAEA